jgi:hypothetical protein
MLRLTRDARQRDWSLRFVFSSLVQAKLLLSMVCTHLRFCDNVDLHKSDTITETSPNRIGSSRMWIELVRQAYVHPLLCVRPLTLQA